jgi:hypothetical protein
MVTAHMTRCKKGLLRFVENVVHVVLKADILVVGVAPLSDDNKVSQKLPAMPVSNGRSSRIQISEPPLSVTVGPFPSHQFAQIGEPHGSPSSVPKVYTRVSSPQKTTNTSFTLSSWSIDVARRLK